MLRSGAAILRFWPFWASLVVALAVACGTTSTAGLPPVTGIIIRAETLTTGRGCGVGPTQLYRYIATVYNDAEFTQQVVTNTFDCFTDGEFVSVPGGDRTFYLRVFAFNKPTWDLVTAPPGAPPDTTKANWATTCVATQQQDVLALADCLPLGSGNLGQGDIQIATGSFPLPDGGTAACATLPDAGPADADIDADIDADTNTDADADAATPPPITTTTFTKAVFRIVRRGTDEIASAGTVTCPTPFLAKVPTGDYRIDVGLTDALDVPVAELTCSVRAIPGTAATATCP